MWIPVRYDWMPTVPGRAICELVAAMYRDHSARFTEYSSTIRDLMLAGF